MTVSSRTVAQALAFFSLAFSCLLTVPTPAHAQEGNKPWDSKTVNGLKSTFNEHMLGAMTAACKCDEKAFLARIEDLRLWSAKLSEHRRLLRDHRTKTIRSILDFWNSRQKFQPGLEPDSLNPAPKVWNDAMLHTLTPLSYKGQVGATPLDLWQNLRGSADFDNYKINAPVAMMYDVESALTSMANLHEGVADVTRKLWSAHCPQDLPPEDLPEDLPPDDPAQENHPPEDLPSEELQPSPDSGWRPAKPCDVDRISIDASVLYGEHVSFCSGDSLPAGRYRITYLEGAHRFSDDPANPYYDWDASSVYIYHDDGKNSLLAPGPTAYRGFDIVADVTAAYAGRRVEFDHKGGKISMHMQDNPYSDNVSGIPAPTYKLEVLEYPN